MSNHGSKVENNAKTKCVNLFMIHANFFVIHAVFLKNNKLSDLLKGIGSYLRVSIREKSFLNRI